MKTVEIEPKADVLTQLARNAEIETGGAFQKRVGITLDTSLEARTG